MVKYTSFINGKTLKMKVSELLKKYDKDGKGINQEEFNSLAKGSVSIFAKPLLTKDLTDKVMSKFDLNADGTVLTDEMKKLLKGYNLDYNKAMNMTVEDVANHINEFDNAKKKAKKKQ